MLTLGTDTDDIDGGRDMQELSCFPILYFALAASDGGGVNSSTATTPVNSSRGWAIL